jgi:hypothetical protein
MRAQLNWAANEQEIQRNPSTVNGTRVEAVSSNVDDKTMHETYLWPFANAVRAGTASVMCSYQRINGSYACQNSKSLNGLLKEELGFQGRRRPLDCLRDALSDGVTRLCGQRLACDSLRGCLSRSRTRTLLAAARALRRRGF